MSFTSDVKSEAARINIDKADSITLLSAIFHNATLDNNIIKFSTENNIVARLVFNLVKDLYNVRSKITVRQGYNYNKNYIYILEISKLASEIWEDLSLKTNIPSNYIVSDDELVRIYLRGVFLTSGSINDPKKSRYHLEFIITDFDYANFICSLLNKYSLNAKVLKRDNRYMVYVKEAEKIGDFLRMIDSINSLFYFEDIRIYRDHKNMTNRLNNCEQANVDKIISTSNDQIKDIEIINSIGGMNLLDDKEKVVAIYKLKYPETSLQELSEIISIETGKKITKSGLYHRFKKIKELANKLRNQNKNS